MSHYVVLQLSLLIYLYCCCCMTLFQLYIMLACLLHHRDIHHKKNASRRVYINVTTTVVKEFEQKTVDKNRIHFSVIMTKRNIIAVALFVMFPWCAHFKRASWSRPEGAVYDDKHFSLVKHCTINKDRQGYYSSFTR